MTTHRFVMFTDITADCGVVGGYVDEVSKEGLHEHIRKQGLDI